MKKTLKIFFIAIICAVLIYLPYCINNTACRIFENEIKSTLSSADKFSVLEFISGCGNPAGAAHPPCRGWLPA